MLATQLFVAAQCHCHSPAILMCSFLSTSINVSPGRHARKWIGVQAFKTGRKGGGGEEKCFIYVSGVHGHLKGRTRVIYFPISLSRPALTRRLRVSASENVFPVRRGARLEPSSCYPKQAGLGPTVSEWRCFRQTE